MTDFEDDGYAYTEISSPVVIDHMLDKNSFLIDKWSRMAAWHKAQRDWRHDQFVKSEARAVMGYEGPATKAKFAAADDPDVQMARTYLSIATAQLGVCERRLHSLEKEAINLATRNKALMQSYNNGGGSY